MRTGVSYMGHHNPKHLTTDFRAMRDLQLDEVFVCLQENDFVIFPGKIRFAPESAREQGIRPLALFWGALNLFGGGRSSHFLLSNPDCFQVARDGSHRSAGCYNNPKAVARILEMIDIIAEAGYEGYFIDEPTPLRNCFCPSCRAKFEQQTGGDLVTAPDATVEPFRQQCVVDYIKDLADYCKANHPQLETFCCLMEHDETLWKTTAQIETLDNLGTDLYWTNNDRDLAEMGPIIDRMAETCRAHNKVHHEWLECWRVEAGREARVREQGEIMVRRNPDAFYVWAWEGQIGVYESCANPELAWAEACKVLRMAKGG